MIEETLTDQIFDMAESLLLEGIQPEPEVVAGHLGCDLAEVETVWPNWWQQLPGRLSSPNAGHVVADVPDSLNQAFSRIWQQALQEANALAALERRQIDLGAEEARRSAEEGLKKSQQQVSDANDRYRAERERVADYESQMKALEAEIKVLKTSLGNETSMLKKEEQRRSNIEQELTHLRKAHEDAKRNFEQRIKDEQRHAIEQVSKAEADVRYFRSALEKVRDDVGKKESTMSRSIHELQAELAKRDVKIDSARVQLKSMETDLKQQHDDSAGRSRDIAKLSNQVLAEANKAKRLDDKVRELEEELKRARHKMANTTTEHSRRENTLRVQVKDKDEELYRLSAKLTAMERRLISQDEEIRRLSGA